MPGTDGLQLYILVNRESDVLTSSYMLFSALGFLRHPHWPCSDQGVRQKWIIRSVEKNPPAPGTERNKKKKYWSMISGCSLGSGLGLVVHLKAVCSRQCLHIDHGGSVL